MSYTSSLSMSSFRSKSKKSSCLPAQFKNLFKATPDKIAVAISIIKAEIFFIWILLLS